MDPGGWAGHSYQAPPLHPRVSSFPSLHNVQAAVLLFLSHLNIMYLHMVVTPVAGWLCKPAGLWVTSILLHSVEAGGHLWPAWNAEEQVCWAASQPTRLSVSSSHVVLSGFDLI